MEYASTAVCPTSPSPATPAEPESAGPFDMSRRPRTAGHATRLALRDAPKPLATYALIAANILVCAWQMLGPGFGGDGLYEAGSLYGPAVAVQPWRLVSAGFLHAGLLHLGFNMYVLADLGTALERTRGRGRFVVAYAVSLCAASLASRLWRPMGLSVGASGAILGLAGFLFVAPPLLPGQSFSTADYRRSVLVWLGAIVLLGFVLPFDNAAHLGGFVGGAAVGAIIDGPLARRAPWMRLASAAGLVALLAAAYVGGTMRIEREPEAIARTHYLRGLALYEHEEFEAADEEFARAIEHSPEALFVVRRAMARIALDDVAGAIRLLRDDSGWRTEVSRWMPHPPSSREREELFRRIDEAQSAVSPLDRLEMILNASPELHERGTDSR